VGTPHTGYLSAMGDSERAPLLGQRVASLRQTEVPILEGEEVGGLPRLSTRAVAARNLRQGTRTNSLRFSIREYEPEPEPPGPDGGWGWVVCLAAFYCISVLDGAAYTFGVFLDPIEVEMGGGHSKVSAAGSLLVATYAFTGILADRMINRFGTRATCITGSLLATLGLGLGSFSKNLEHIMICYSIITGVGFGLMYLPAIVSTANHFTKQRSLAIAFCLCGAGFGTFTLSPLETYIVHSHGWRWGFLSLSALALASCIAGLTMVPVDRTRPGRSSTPTTLATTPEEPPVTSLSAKVGGFILGPSLYASPALGLYLLVALADVMATLSLFIPFHYTPSIAHERGLTSAQGAMLISAIGVFSTIGRVIAGWISDRGWFHPLSIASLSVTLVTPPLWLLTVCNSFPTFIVCCSLYGFLTGCWISVMSPIFVRILGLDLLSQAFAFLTAVRGFATLAGPPLAGALVDWATEKSASIHLSGSAMLLSSIIFLASNLLSARRDNKARNGAV